MVFYTDYCLHYCDLDLIFEKNYLIDPFAEINMLEEFSVYYIEKYLDAKAYINIRELINQFTEEITDDEEKREVIKNIIKLKLNEGEFLSNNMDGIDVYITPHNYKELKEAIMKSIELEEEEELELE